MNRIWTWKLMHKTEAVLENIKHKILWGAEIQTDNTIHTRSNPILVNKKKIWQSRLLFHETTERKKYFDLAKELKFCETWWLIVVGKFGRFSKNFTNIFTGNTEKIHKKYQEYWDECCRIDFQYKKEQCVKIQCKRTTNALLRFKSDANQARLKIK